MSAERPAMRSSPEFDLIGAIRERMEATTAASDRIRIGIGDDAAVTAPGGATATTVDAIVDGFGFRRRWCPPRAIGRKALGAALSDLAAMGAAPGEAYVWLGAPADFGRESCLELAEGIAELALQTGVAVIGGDVTAAGELAVSVTAVGHAGSAEELVGRAGAEAGDALCATGAFGGAAAGLMLLEHERIHAAVADPARGAAIVRQLSPRPQLDAGRALAASGARAMIDVSDGLGADAEHLAAASRSRSRGFRWPPGCARSPRRRDAIRSRSGSPGGRTTSCSAPCLVPSSMRRPRRSRGAE